MQKLRCKAISSTMTSSGHRPLLQDQCFPRYISCTLKSIEIFEFFRIELCGIYRIYRIYRGLFLIILFSKQLKIVFYKFYRYCRFYRIQFGKTRFCRHASKFTREIFTHRVANMETIWTKRSLHNGYNILAKTEVRH